MQSPAPQGPGPVLDELHAVNIHCEEVFRHMTALAVSLPPYGQAALFRDLEDLQGSLPVIHASSRSAAEEAQDLYAAAPASDWRSVITETGELIGSYLDLASNLTRHYGGTPLKRGEAPEDTQAALAVFHVQMGQSPSR